MPKMVTYHFLWKGCNVNHAEEPGKALNTTVPQHQQGVRNLQQVEKGLKSCISTIGGGTFEAYFEVQTKTFLFHLAFEPGGDE